MAMWGGRFGAETDKELAKFSESISYDRRLYPYDIAGSKAHVKMLGATGIIPVATAKAIEDGLEEILHLIQDGKFTFKQELEDIHMNIESALIDKLGPEGARLHSARSRNDQVALDIRLYLRHEIREIQQLLRGFQHALFELADANKTVIMPGFTHLQHAQVVLFAHHLLAYVEMFDRDFDRLDDCYKRVNVMPLGAGAIAGTTLPIDREMVCRELDFARITRNSMDSVADRDFIIELLADLAKRKQAGIVFASNYSVGMNLLFYLSKKVAGLLADYDVEIIEAHHNQKKDAPSGTAVTIAEGICEARGLSYEKDVVHGRCGMVGARTKTEIGMHAIRGGDIVGDHTVMFATTGERFEMTHKASSRTTFARGAVRAVAFLETAKPGLYSMQDVLGLH